jgi:hypothetical protein
MTEAPKIRILTAAALACGIAVAQPLSAGSAEWVSAADETSGSAVSFGAVSDSGTFPIASGVVLPERAGLPEGTAPTWQVISQTVPEDAEQGGDGGVKTGNKPSTFNYRINPYVRYNKLENGAEIMDYSVFLMMPVKWFGLLEGAFVYEGPVVRDQDLTDIGGGKDTGYADPVIRAPMIFKPFQTGKFNWIPVFIQEFTLPFGKEELTGDTLVMSPGGGFVISSNPRWFLAAIQFYDFDISKSSGAEDVNRIRMRYFLQYMASPKHRIYVMPEFQASFDFETDENSFWIAPEFGKVIRPIQGSSAGFVVYAKPGFGIGNKSNSFEREWSMEVGVRWMWDEFPLGG